MDLIYDIETYPNCFLIGIRSVANGDRWQFEISSRRNDVHLFQQMLTWMSSQNHRMVGFNNLAFDYPVIHRIHNLSTAEEIYQIATDIIQSDDKFGWMVWEPKVTQVDLFKIHHFDNRARSTSLKVLEFNMRMDSIEDLPFPVGTTLTPNQMDTLAKYMWHDIDATFKFYLQTLPQIRFREQLSQQYDRNFINHNDTRIGKDYFIMQLEERNPGCCYDYSSGRRQLQQTHRDEIHLGEVLLPYIHFDHPEFKRIHNWFKNATITETRGSIDLSCVVDGLVYHFGTGGIHASIKSQIVESTEEYILEDWDVTSYYPSLAIVNKFYPQHLGEDFCHIYQMMFEQRSQYPKGSPENAMLKLALNGVYGDSNNVWSPFFDPKYTMSITVNGQLLLCMVADVLIRYGVEIIQMNTDGLTIRYRPDAQLQVHQLFKSWEERTGLSMERVVYRKMAIRDVNNYIAMDVNNNIKRKGAYDYEPGWHQDHSALVVAKAAEAALMYGRDVDEFIHNHSDIMDFMYRAKAPRGSWLEWGFNKIQSTSRYYVSTDGDILDKVMPPAGQLGAWKRKNGITDYFYNQVLAEVGDAWDERIHTKAKTKYEMRRTTYHQGYTIMLANDVSQMSFSDVDYDFYIREANKLVEPINGRKGKQS